MINWNGWYKYNFKTVEELKSFYREAASASNDIKIDIKADDYRRVSYDGITVEEYIEKYLNDSSHNVICNRYEYNGRANWAEEVGEIGSSTMHLPRNIFIWIYLPLDVFNNLVEKYNFEKH